MGEKIKILLNKLFNYNFIIFNLFIILATLIAVIIYHLWDLFPFNFEYYYEGFHWYFLIDTQAIVVISIIILGLFNVIRYERLGKKYFVYPIIIIAPFLISWEVINWRMDERIFTAACIFLPISLCSYYVIKKEINVVLKVILISLISTVIYFAGSLIGWILGFLHGSGP